MGAHFITEHALDRFREHHPQATMDDLWDHLRYGTAADPSAVKTLLQRTYNPEGDKYVLSPDRRGIFALGPDKYHGADYVVKTYMRLSPWHRELVLAWWPPGV